MNTEMKRLLNTPEGLLTHLENQYKFVLKQALREPACPWCKKPLSQVDAWEAKHPGIEFDVKGYHGDDDYQCAHCGHPVHWVLPLLVIDNGWFWTTGGREAVPKVTP